MNPCECGCGVLVTGLFKRGHFWKVAGNCEARPPQKRGAAANNWRGGISRTAGYRTVHVPGHPNAHGGHVLEHVLVVSRALGKAVPANAVVHHVDENPLNNDPSNLVLCEDRAYHMLLHQRQRAQDACGNASWRSCTHCKSYDAPENLVIPPQSGRQPYHRECSNKNARDRRAKRKQLESAA